MKVPEATPLRRRLIAAATLLALGSGLETIGQIENDTLPVPSGACLSPAAFSETYIDADANLWLQTYTGFLTEGVLVHSRVPRNAYGVVVSFKSPEDPESIWQANASQLVAADNAGNVALKLAVGPEPVEFQLRAAGPQGSMLCDTLPNASFDLVSAGNYFGTEAIVPYTNPVNSVVNIFN